MLTNSLKKLLKPLFVHSIPVLFLSLYCVSCNQPVPENQKLITDIDSLRTEIRELKKALELQQDSSKKLIVQDSVPKVKVDDTVIKKKTEPPVVKKVTPSPQKSPMESDTLYHYYSNGKISVKITPWQEGRRKSFFYDLYGAETFQIEDVRLSYSVTTQLKFHPNGAVSKAEIHSNPGASRYWYESTITFSTTNDPLLKYSRQMPQERIDLDEQKPMFWNKQKKEWMRQEIVQEQPVPEK